MQQVTKLQDCTIEVCTLTQRYYISLGATRSRKDYKTFAGAVKYAKSRYNLVSEVDPMMEYLANANKTKIVKNLISGKLVRIPVNTPGCCDPSTESYWSM